MKFNKLSLIGLVCAAGILASTGALAAGTANVVVSATVVGSCKFNSGGAVAFTLDPSVGGNSTGTVTQPVFWCTKGTTYGITDNNGANAGTGGVQRMKHATLAEFIPYSFVYTAAGAGTGPATPITMNITSSVVATDYLNASAGSYTDTVILSITP